MSCGKHLYAPSAWRPIVAGLALSIGILCLASAAGAQGIYPGEPPKAGYKLPGDIEPVVQLRTYYFDQQNPGGAPNVAWALGGWAGLRSPWWGDFLQGAVNFYTSQRLYGPSDEGGTKLLQSNQTAINVLGEAFGAIRFAGQTFTGYRQLINRPFVDPQDSRMVPNTFEAYTVTGKVDQLSYIGGYITKEKLRDTESFRWMSNVAGGTGNQEGVAFGGMTYEFGKSGYLRIDEQYGTDVFNTFYADFRYPIAMDDKTTLALGGQYYPQSSVGKEQLGSFSTWGYGLEATLARGPSGMQLYWQQTGKGRDTLSPFGTHASYLGLILMQNNFNTAGEKAWMVGANVDLGTIGVPGLTAAAWYANGHGLINYSTGASLSNQNETDVRVDYAFPKGSLLEGLVATFRYSWLNQGGTQQTQLRAYINYPVRF